MIQVKKRKIILEGIKLLLCARFEFILTKTNLGNLSIMIFTGRQFDKAHENRFMYLFMMTKYYYKQQERVKIKTLKLTHEVPRCPKRPGQNETLQEILGTFRGTCHWADFFA